MRLFKYLLIDWKGCWSISGVNPEHEIKQSEKASIFVSWKHGLQSPGPKIFWNSESGQSQSVLAELLKTYIPVIVNIYSTVIFEGQFFPDKF